MPTENSTEGNNSAPDNSGTDSKENKQENNNTPSKDNDATPGSLPATQPDSRAAHHGGGQAPGLNELATAIAGMPERIVSALREATQTPRSASSGSPDTGTQERGSGSQNVSEGESRKPGRKSFAQWWFG